MQCAMVAISLMRRPSPHNGDPPGHVKKNPRRNRVVAKKIDCDKNNKLNELRVKDDVK